MASPQRDQTLYPIKEVGGSVVDGKFYSATDAGGASFGEVGSQSITGVTAITPDTGFYFAAIQIIGDAVISAQGDVTGATNADLTAFTSITAGIILYGKWDSITLSSGQAIGYYKADA